MKVKSTFLNSDLEEEIYIEQPKGFVMNKQKKKSVSLLNYYLV